MKALKIIYSFLVVGWVGYGVPLTIINIGKEPFVPCLIIALVGLALFVLGAVYLMKTRNKE